MINIFKYYLIALIFSTIMLPQNNSKMQTQNPSPMIENIRAHERITKKDYDGIDFSIYLLSKQVEVFIPQKSIETNSFDLLIHFHGADYVVKYAAENYVGNIISVTVNLGSGSSVYYDQFNDSTLFNKLIYSVKIKAEQKLNRPISFNKIILSGFSAGYGAIKHLLFYKNSYDKINSIILLDGLHASYIPENKTLYEGGKIDSSALQGFLGFTKDASESKKDKKFLFTHSEIFPGTYASTTETADYLTKKLNLKIKPVLKWGPLGMQLLGEVRKDNFIILAFAGNTAPDHIDHLHGLFYFLNILSKM